MRWLDHSVLGAAVPVLALLNRHRPLPIAPQRIGIIQPAAIGDTFIASGAVAAITRRYPAAQVFLFHGTTNAAAVSMIDAPITPILCDFSRPDRVLAILRSHHLDLVVDQTPWPNLTAVLARLSAACTVGFAPRGTSRGRLFDVPIPHRTDRHELDNLEAMADAFGATGVYRMQLRIKACSAARDLLLRRTVICHLAAGGTRAQEKAWPLQYWAILCSRLMELGYIPLFTGVAADQRVVDELRDRLGDRGGSTISLCGKVPLNELGDLLARVHAVVSVDTSLLHLAGAVDARVYGLHGPTSSRRWGARSRRARSFDSPHPAAGFIAYGIETHPAAMEVMKALTPDLVLPIICNSSLSQGATAYAQPSSA
jgi:ADP-heptose:LPS heptosyltransferase